MADDPVRRPPSLEELGFKVPGGTGNEPYFKPKEPIESGLIEQPIWSEESRDAEFRPERQLVVPEGRARASSKVFTT